ncbi:PQQ-dependent sugar dehydrogenase [Oceanicoccus sp. KOV_DT_Chl]|uniref:PQQ-dependent sugar dehydrogenase n=1 Tax=Oceanicoccus sp. KOV_DT_Chl TaxID=1904639 RepID=UPI000C7B0952|nr:PQQ-dependent sugar dehydrogenase [Oceanicoccus sp. KOV_DT_Chl]
MPQLLIAYLMTCSVLFNSAAVSAEAVPELGFKPLKINWEKMSQLEMKDSFISLFNKNCASCHGEDLAGTGLGPALVGVTLRHGDSTEALAVSIRNGYPTTGMPAWADVLKETKIQNLALYVAEQRQGTTILDKKATIEFQLSAATIKTERHQFRYTLIAEGLAALPFSIAPLPDGRILLSERMRGLSIISTSGLQSPLIKGAPPAYDDAGQFLGQVNGLGWMMDVALHPDYKNNGWIYLQHGDRCSDCNAFARQAGRPVSMNRLVRGRIKDGQWVDQQILWQADINTYTDTTDLSAGGRIAFDDKGFVYFSIGMKGPMDYDGTQDLRYPYGKIMRLHDDGRIPVDNPFLKKSQAVKAIWTYGHRSVQGLEFNPATGEMWSTEMGPRGGDELNRLVKGGNYGWPIFTNGVNYTGFPVDGAKKTGIHLKPEQAIFPVVDMTPSPALSSFIFYTGEEFPQWKNTILLGTLRAADLWLLELNDNKVIHREKIIDDLARFRDIELGPKGELYLLLELKAGSKILQVEAVK